MALGTLDRTPPPFFRQGTSALTKLTCFSALALFLMVADTRFEITQPLRAVLATVLHPLQRTILFPVWLWQDGGGYFRSLQRAQAAEAAALISLNQQAENIAQLGALQTENERLRSLLRLQPRLRARHQAVEVLYAAADPYSRKVVVNRGRRHGVLEGSPVINEQGVLGQVTRVYPLSSEVTLLTDKDASIPVLNNRTQQRGAAFGITGANIPNGNLELRYMATNADVQVGDVLTTSGLDGIYPAGLLVAKVALVERKSQDSFARILLSPIAPSDNLQHALLLEPLGRQMAELPGSVQAPPALPPKKGSKQ